MSFLGVDERRYQTADVVSCGLSRDHHIPTHSQVCSKIQPGKTIEVNDLLNMFAGCLELRISSINFLKPFCDAQGETTRKISYFAKCSSNDLWPIVFRVFADNQSTVAWF